MICTRCEESPRESDAGWMKDAQGRDWHVSCAQVALANHPYSTKATFPEHPILNQAKQTRCTDIVHLVRGASRCPRCGAA